MKKIIFKQKDLRTRYYVFMLILTLICMYSIVTYYQNEFIDLCWCGYTYLTDHNTFNNSDLPDIFYGK